MGDNNDKDYGPGWFTGRPKTPETIIREEEVQIPTWDKSLYVLQPQYGITPAYENYEKGTSRPASVYKISPGVLAYEAWEKTQTFNGVQDRDLEYDKYLFSMWEPEVAKGNLFTTNWGEGYRMSDKQKAEYLNALNRVMVEHRNQWNEKQEYWNARRKAGTQSEPTTFTYTVERSRTRSTMQNLELTSENNSGISKVSNSKLPAVGLTQIKDKALG